MKEGLRQRLLEKAYEKAKGHRERVKNRFLEEGPGAFTDEDLLELVLMFGIPYKDTRGIARELLKKYKTFDGVLDAPLEELIEFKGLGKKAVLPLKVVREAARRYLKQRALKATYLKSPEEVYEYLRYEMQNLDREVFKVIFLDARARLIGIDTIFEGTLTEAVVYPREVFQRAFQKRAVSIVLVHNHPSGCTKPSQADILITERMLIAGLLLDIKLLDHIVIGKEGYFSMAEEGIIDSLKNKWKGVEKP
ncbi:MAG: JAB domain-containing protein [Thermodesulfobacteria bacterium]|nr:JAB domain-containing protein [Thermodesulfobacteriota bacterium]